MSTDVEDVDRQALIEERDFLLRSLDDLDEEHRNGELDAESYDVLRARYVERAAEVDRSLRRSEVPSSPGSPEQTAAPWRRGLVITGIVAFVVAASVVLALALSDRGPGESLTGNEPSGSVPAGGSESEDLEPYLEQLSVARSLLDTDLAAALAAYDAARVLAPDEPEPPAYMGWIYGQAAEQTSGAERAELLGRALENLDAARALDPDYPDAHAFTGLVLLNVADDPASAVEHLQRFLVLAPQAAQSDLVRSALATAVARTEAATSDSSGPDGGAPASAE